MPLGGTLWIYWWGNPCSRQQNALGVGMYSLKLCLHSNIIQTNRKDNEVPCRCLCSNCSMQATQVFCSNNTCGILTYLLAQWACMLIFLAQIHKAKHDMFGNSSSSLLCMAVCPLSWDYSATSWVSGQITTRYLFVRNQSASKLYSVTHASLNQQRWCLVASTVSLTSNVIIWKTTGSEICCMCTCPKAQWNSDIEMCQLRGGIKYSIVKFCRVLWGCGEAFGEICARWHGCCLSCM